MKRSTTAIAVSLLFLLSFPSPASAETSPYQIHTEVAVDTPCEYGFSLPPYTSSKSGKTVLGWLKLLDYELLGYADVAEFSVIESDCMQDPAVKDKEVVNRGCSPGYELAGKVHTSPGFCDQWPEGEGYGNSETSSGWIGFCTGKDASGEPYIKLAIAQDVCAGEPWTSSSYNPCPARYAPLGFFYVRGGFVSGGDPCNEPGPAAEIDGREIKAGWVVLCGKYTIPKLVLDCQQPPQPAPDFVFHTGAMDSNAGKECEQEQTYAVLSSGTRVKAGWLKLESSGKAVLTALSTDSCPQDTAPLQTASCADLGYDEAGDFHTAPGICDDYAEIAKVDKSTTSGTVGLCTQSESGQPVARLHAARDDCQSPAKSYDPPCPSGYEEKGRVRVGADCSSSPAHAFDPDGNSVEVKKGEIALCVKSGNPDIQLAADGNRYCPERENCATAGDEDGDGLGACDDPDCDFKVCEAQAAQPSSAAGQPMEFPKCTGGGCAPSACPSGTNDMGLAEDIDNAGAVTRYRICGTGGQVVKCTARMPDTGNPGTGFAWDESPGKICAASCPAGTYEITQDPKAGGEIHDFSDGIKNAAVYKVCSSTQNAMELKMGTESADPAKADIPSCTAAYTRVGIFEERHDNQIRKYALCADNSALASLSPTGGGSPAAGATQLKTCAQRKTDGCLPSSIPSCVSQQAPGSAKAGETVKVSYAAAGAVGEAVTWWATASQFSQGFVPADTSQNIGVSNSASASFEWNTCGKSGDYYALTSVKSPLLPDGKTRYNCRPTAQGGVLYLETESASSTKAGLCTNNCATKVTLTASDLKGACNCNPNTRWIEATNKCCGANVNEKPSFSPDKSKLACCGTAQCFDPDEKEASKQCQSSGFYKGDNYCENGQWTSRTKLAALYLADYAVNNLKEYTLFCDDYTKAATYFSYTEGSTAAQDLITGCSGSGVTRCLNNICVLRGANNQDKEEVLLATSLNQPIDASQKSFLTLVNEPDCNGAKGKSDDTLLSCNANQRLWYNPSKQIAAYSAQSFSPNPSPNLWQGFVELLLTPFRALFGLIQEEFKPTDEKRANDYKFITETSAFSRLYLERKGDRAVHGVIETVFDDSGNKRETMAIEYTNFQTDLCSHPSITAPELGADCFRKQDSQTVSASGSAALERWQDLTAKLRTS